MTEPVCERKDWEKYLNPTKTLTYYVHERRKINKGSKSLLELARSRVELILQLTGDVSFKQR